MKINELLIEIEKQIIGTFTVFKDPTNSIWFVIKDENDQLTCIQVTKWLALHELHIDKQEGWYVKFDNNETLNDIKKDHTNYSVLLSQY